MPGSRGRYGDTLHGIGTYTPAAAFGVRYDDPAFGIHLPLAPTCVSAQDRGWPLFEQRESAVAG